MSHIGFPALALTLWLAVPVFGEESDWDAAREHLQKGRYAEALEAYQALAESGAGAARAAAGLSRVHEAEGRWDEATAVVEAALDAAPRDADLRGRLAELQLRQGRYAAAEKSAEEALALDPQHPAARLVQADVFAETGRLREADDAYRWFVRFYNQTQPADAETLLLVARGSLEYARWNRVPAIFNFVVNTLFPDALKDDPLSWQAHHLSGELLLEKYNRAQALPDLRQALAVNPRASEVLASLGNAAFQQHALEEAEDYADRALKINPRLVPALHLQADLRLGSGRLAEAREFVDAALAVNPHDQRTLARLAAAWLLSDGLIDADLLEAVLAAFGPADEVPDVSEDALTPGLARFVPLVRELASRNPRPGPFLTILGQTLENHRRFDAAERCYEAAIAVMPQLAEPKTALGMLAMRVGRTGEARTILDEAFKADPYHVRVSNMRKVLDLLDGYETITTDHFVIRIDSAQDRILGRYVAEYLEEIYPELVEQFGFEPPHRTHFEIYHRGKGLSAHEWFSARMVGLPWIQTIGASTGVIVALASPTATDKPFNWARVLRHELVHVITLQQTRFNIPHWFTEALAVVAEGYPRPQEWNALLLERVPAGDLRSLDELNDAFIRPKSAADWTFAYCQSRLYAEYMVETYGAASIPAMLDAYREGLSTEQAIAWVFQVDVPTFERGYRSHVEALAASLQGGAPEEPKSLAELERAHRDAPDDPRAAAAFAHELLNVRRRQQARDLALQALERNPKEPLAALVMAELALRAEDREQAVGYLRQALDRERPHRAVLARLARLALQQRDSMEAAALFELGRRRFPHDPEWLKGLAAAHLAAGDTDRLKAVLIELAETDADDQAARRKLAEIALDEGDDEAAIRYGRLALHIDVLDPDVHRILGEAYRRTGRIESALREFEIALELEPGDAAAEVGLARALLTAGRRAEARARLTSLLEREPDHEEARRLLQQSE